MTSTARQLSGKEQSRVLHISDELQIFLEQANLDEDDKVFVTGHLEQLKNALAGAFMGNETPESLTAMTAQQLHQHITKTAQGISPYLHRSFNKAIEHPNPHLMRIAVQYLKFVDAFKESLGIAAQTGMSPRA